MMVMHTHLLGIVYCQMVLQAYMIEVKAFLIYNIRDIYKMNMFTFPFSLFSCTMTLPVILLKGRVVRTTLC